MNYKYFNILFVFVFFGALNVFAQTNKDYPVQGVPFNKVTINDKFWLPKIEINRIATIPNSFRKCEETGRIENFILASKKTGKLQTTYPFDDSDVFKIIEGASFSMTVHSDPALDHYVDSLIAIIGNAQEPDGYLYTARTIDPKHPHEWSGSERWVKEAVLSHELYNMGHLYEAAAAHYIATGKRNLLDIALKNANLLLQVYGPGKRSVAPGHAIIEMGLVRLYRITNEQKYLDLAKFFIDCRGKEINPNNSYSQNHKPLIQQEEAVGHAVRAAYFYSGVADVAALTGDSAYIKAIDKIWDNTVSKKFYINGGLGARHDGEAFGDNYELPNLTAYNETCASIANVYWNYRMFLLHGNAKYIDVLERSLYNNVISGVGIDGKTFFYPNPLACDMKYKFNQGGSLTREPWFDCSCCPTNLSRFLPSVSGYIYAQKENSLYVNLFISSSTTLKLNGKQDVKISQNSNYPWDGVISLSIYPQKATRFALRLRIPGWVQNQPVPSNLYNYVSNNKNNYILKINGKKIDAKIVDGYAVIDRKWKKSDKVELNLPMNVQRVITNEKVLTNRGFVALERGPILFCVEEKDNAFDINSLVLSDESLLSFIYNKDILGGAYCIKGVGSPTPDKFDSQFKTEIFTAIPYYLWNNRGTNKMNVWLSRKINQTTLSPESLK